MLVTAIVFSLAHVYAAVLGTGVSQGDANQSRGGSRVTGPLGARRGRHPAHRRPWRSGRLGVFPDRTALVAATVLALVELAAAGGYAAIRHGADLRGTIVSAAIALVLGLALVLLKALVH